MKSLYLGVQRFLNDEEGVTAIEYALIASLIAVVILLAVSQTGTILTNTFENVCATLNNNTACS